MAAAAAELLGAEIRTRNGPEWRQHNTELVSDVRHQGTKFLVTRSLGSAELTADGRERDES
jgi:hypothetical protein